MTEQHPSETCPTCLAYLARRDNERPPLPLAVVAFAKSRKVDAADLFRRFMRAVHERHLSGKSLARDAKP